MTIQVTIVADSVSPAGIRLTTVELVYHRYVHAELLTHRVFSRNSSSSRAIPTKRLSDQEVWLPLNPATNQRGMQPGEPLDEDAKALFLAEWYNLALVTTDCVKRWSDKYKVHKQWANRPLEWFTPIRVLVTATEWDNFFNLRLAGPAQEEIREVARQLQKAMDASEPRVLKPGEWHLPYVSDYDYEGNPSYYDDPAEIIKLSVARCARESYLTHDRQVPNRLDDLRRHDQLLADRHLSPFEHQATPMSTPSLRYSDVEIEWDKGVTHIDRNWDFWSGNFRGWIQNRQLIV